MFGYKGEFSRVHDVRTNYWPQLDGLRTIAFLLVFFHHHWAPAHLLPVPFQGMMVKTAEWGWLGVDLFFVLSAFLVTHLLCVEIQTYRQISLSKFYARRALRIWPLFFLVLFSIAFAYPLFAPNKASHLYAEFVRQIVIPICTFQGNFAIANHFNTIQEYAKGSGLDFMVFVTFLVPFWSLCVEEQFYLLWGALARLLNSINRLMVCTAILVGIGFFSRILLLTNRGAGDSTCYYMHSLWHLDTIMLGALLAIVLLSKPGIMRPLQSGWLPPVLFAACITTFVAVTNLAPGIHSGDMALAPLMTILSIVGTLLLALVLHWRPLSKALSLKWLVQIGKLTFAMYVFHYPVIWFARVGFGLSVEGWQGVGSLLLSLGLTYSAALISWRVLEKPMNDVRRRFSMVHPSPLPIEIVAAPSIAQPVREVVLK